MHNQDAIALAMLIAAGAAVCLFLFVMFGGLVCTIDNHTDPYNPHRKPDSVCVWMGMSK